MDERRLLAARAEQSVPGGLLVANLPETGKADLDAVEVVVEADLVYPLLRAGDVLRWRATSTYSILMVQDPENRRGYDEDWLKTSHPKTYAYLARFREALESRSGYKRYFDAGDPFYSMFNVADYTFAKHKAVFPSIGNELQCAVVSAQDGKPIVPQHIVTMVASDDEDEAHYVCACMNSTPARFTLEAYSQKGGKSFATPQALEHVKVPSFDRSLETHVRLAECSRGAHEAARKDAGVQVASAEEEIDELAASLWGLTSKQMEDLRLSLSESREKPLQP